MKTASSRKMDTTGAEREHLLRFSGKEKSEILQFCDEYGIHTEKGEYPWNTRNDAIFAAKYFAIQMKI